MQGMQTKNMTVNYRRELHVANVSIAVTITLFAALFQFLASHIYSAATAHNFKLLAEDAVFTSAMLFMAYGNLLYQFCLIGFYKRKLTHKAESMDELMKLYDAKAPSLSILVPSYKEERCVIWQTLVSAALAEYPQKNVVLLIDDPYHARALEDIVKLEDTRTIPVQLQQKFSSAAARYQSEAAAFLQRKEEGKAHAGIELNRLSMLYEDVASWLDALAGEYTAERGALPLTHLERFFVDEIILKPAASHHAMAVQLREAMTAETLPDEAFLARHYSRLASLFNVRFSSFERKKYVNLSHEANKAMNLNSYLALIGKSWKEMEGKDGLELIEAFASEADFTIPDVDYVNTLDADSLMVSDYALRLVHVMQKPGNERVAVAQSPHSSFPNCPNAMEHTAGACIDVQFHTHQGYAHWNATSWVGANAMLRRTALEDIKETREENGHNVAVYIQDRTVIEDTESTIDLVERGWKLYNYPERMTFSPTPPDFGSLLIQRRRWANGGLIILPKMLSYVANAPKSLSLLKEFFLRFYYLSSGSITCVFGLLLLSFPFGAISGSPLVFLSALPCLMLFSRDLKNTGYKYSDVLRVWALNLMLFPIVVGGTFKQFQQMVTGKKIPFGRTPKVPGRTAAPALYCLIEMAFPMVFFNFALQAALQQQWAQMTFELVNASFFAYALVYFIGIKEALQDMTADVRVLWRNAFHHAEILPFPAIRWMSASFVRDRKRA
jgi:cellulose synthase/poly-beta-1,6-N-acetylglucosamine synthase-like glycosyltransferase